MIAEKIGRATRAALRVSERCGLDSAVAEVLQDSNRLVLRVQPCDVIARVADATARPEADLEVALVRQLERAGAPVARLDAKADAQSHFEDGFVVTLWTYYAPVPPREVAPDAYTSALEKLHRSLREVVLPAPHFTDRVTAAVRLAASQHHTPALADCDRELLCSVLRFSNGAVAAAGAPEQLLHGEPHSDNLLRTKDGLLFTDFEACCRGPLEFDIADIPKDVGAVYPGVNHALLSTCRLLVLAMVATWCWAGYEEHENLRHAAPKLVDQVRAAWANGTLTP